MRGDFAGCKQWAKCLLIIDNSTKTEWSPIQTECGLVKIKAGNPPITFEKIVMVMNNHQITLKSLDLYVWPYSCLALPPCIHFPCAIVSVYMYAFVSSYTVKLWDNGIIVTPYFNSLLLASPLTLITINSYSPWWRLIMVDKHLINQARGPYWENIGPRSVQKRPRADRIKLCLLFWLGFFKTMKLLLSVFWDFSVRRRELRLGLTSL